MSTLTWNAIGRSVGVLAGENESGKTLTFPLETLVRVAAYSIGIGAGMFVSTAALRENVTSIRKELEMQGKLEELKSQRQDERMQQLRTTIDDMRRRQELQQYEIQGLKETILKAGGGK